MRIAINARLLLPNRLEGIGWFAHETVGRMVREHPEHRFTLLFDRRPAPEFAYGPNAEAVVLRPQARHPLLWYLWFEHAVARYLNDGRNAIDAMFSPEGYLALRARCPQVLTLHDINFYHNPERLRRSHARFLNRYTPQYVRKSHTVVTVSEFSRADICAAYGLPPEHVAVVHNGVDTHFRPLAPAEAEGVRQQVSGGQPYFVFVGALTPRKNVLGLIAAFELFKRRSGLPHRLVVVGGDLHEGQEVRAARRQSAVAQHIVMIGRQQRSALAPLVGAAQAMVYPSFFEGFGVPLAEAMRCGVPLAVSSTSAMPEVAGQAAIYFDPHQTPQIAEAMARLATQPQLRQELSERALERARLFEWDLSARQLYNIIERAATSQKA
ncbi:MAG: glycosyltransferase family 4 protein [Bacteroidales bacterium]|nr:glycosyltransferase family 4 protein [Bacteroidales bacterium]